MKTTINERTKTEHPLLKASLFVFIFVILYLLINWALIVKRYPSGEMEINSLPVLAKPTFRTFTFKEFDRNAKYDLIFLGSSHCYRAFDPRLFVNGGINAYNLGSSSQTPINSFPILKSVIHNTSHVVLEVYPPTLSTSGREAFVKLVPDMDNYVLLSKMVWELKDFRCAKLLTIKPLLDYYNRDCRIDHSNYYRGYAVTDHNPEPNTTYATYDLDEKQVDEQLEYVEKIIRLCQRNKVKIALVYAPIPKELYMKREGRVIRKLNNISRKYNIHFYNYGRKLNLPSRTCFFDDDHLNKHGVSIFDKVFIDRIKQDGFAN